MKSTDLNPSTTTTVQLLDSNLLDLVDKLLTRVSSGQLKSTESSFALLSFVISFALLDFLVSSAQFGRTSSLAGEPIVGAINSSELKLKVRQSPLSLELLRLNFRAVCFFQQRKTAEHAEFRTQKSKFESSML